MSYPEITFENHTRRKLPLRRLTRLLQETCDLLDIERGAWSVNLVNDRAMARLHEQTMNLATTTDVLTFDLGELPRSGKRRKPPKVLELDTVICLDEAYRQARGRNHELWQEVLLYAVHSLLHVSGYDDLTPGEAARMHRREDELLLALGVGKVFDSMPSPATGPGRARGRSKRSSSAAKPAKKDR